MTLVGVLPEVNATLNATSGALLLCGLRAIRAGRREVHRRFMLGACVASVLFLIGYVTRVALQGTHRFGGHGIVRTLYLAILTSHMILAVAILPLVLRTLYLALSGRFDRHRRLARVTFPAWLYVSVTGVVVYAMLYHLPGGAR
jgi:putative membrane protein